MSKFEDNVPFLNSPRLHRYGPGYLGSRDHDDDDPLNERYEPEENMEDSEANNGLHHSRQDVEDFNSRLIYPTGSPRIGRGDQEERRSRDSRTSADQGFSKSEGSKTLEFQHDSFEGIKDSKKHKENL